MGRDDSAYKLFTAVNYLVWLGNSSVGEVIETAVDVSDVVIGAIGFGYGALATGRWLRGFGYGALAEEHIFCITYKRKNLTGSAKVPYSSTPSHRYSALSSFNIFYSCRKC